MAGRAGLLFPFTKLFAVNNSSNVSKIVATKACKMSGSSNFAPKNDVMLPKGAFDGKVAFVTGGGTGLGQGMVKILSLLGAKVAIMSRYVQTSCHLDHVGQIDNHAGKHVCYAKYLWRGETSRTIGEQ